MPQSTVEGRLAQPRIVLLNMQERFADESWPEVERMAKAELEHLGLRVLRARAEADGTDMRLAELGAAAARHRAVAALRIVRQGTERRVRLWLYDAVTGKMLLRELVLTQAQLTEGRREAALQVVELLHASLLEIRLPRRPHAKRPVPKLVKRMVAEQLDTPAAGAKGPSRWTVQLGGGVLANPSQLDVVGAVRLGVSWRVLRRVELDGHLLLPALSPTAETAAGEATVSPFIARLLLRALPWPGARLSPALAAGLGAMTVRAAGVASAPLRGATDWSASVLLSSEARVALRLTRSLQLSASLGLDVALPAARLRFSGVTVAKLGLPQLEGMLGLQWAL